MTSSSASGASASWRLSPLQRPGFDSNLWRFAACHPCSLLPSLSSCTVIKAIKAPKNVTKINKYKVDLSSNLKRKVVAKTGRWCLTEAEGAGHTSSTKRARCTVTPLCVWPAKPMSFAVNQLLDWSCILVSLKTQEMQTVSRADVPQNASFTGYTCSAHTGTICTGICTGGEFHVRNINTKH